MPTVINKRFAKQFVLFCSLVISVLLAPALTLPTRAQTAIPLRIGVVEALPNSLDPALANDFFAWELLSTVHVGLTRQVAGTLDYELALAGEKLQTDPITYRYVLRPDAAFADGTPITAEIFAESLGRAAQIKDGLVGRYLSAAIANADGSLTLQLQAPIGYLDQLLALPPFAPVHPRQATIGNGPYQVQSHSANEIVLAANPAWAGVPAASPLVQIKRYFYPSELYTAIQSGQIDLAWRGVLPSLHTETETANFQTIHSPSLDTYYLVLAANQDPFTEPVARQALQYLLDRPRAVKAVLGDLGAPLFTLVPPELLSQQPAYPGFDSAQADSLLKAAGYSRYKRIESEILTARGLYGIGYQQLADSLGRPLSRHEIYRLFVSDAEAKSFLDQAERGVFRAQVIGWRPIVPSAEAYLTPLLAGSLASAVHYDGLASHPELTALVASATPEAWRKAIEIAISDSLVIPLWRADQVLWCGPNVDCEALQAGGLAANFRLFYETLRAQPA
jgi:peptide/nickel transport system substrate-binding protein